MIEEVGTIEYKTSFHDLPYEIVIKILALIRDGQTAINSKRVCKLWCSIINSLELTPSFWEDCCLNEISTRIILSLCDQYIEYASSCNFYSGLISDGDNNFTWKNIYSHFKRYQYINRRQYNLQELPCIKGAINKSCVTFMDICGNNVFLGFENGEVFGFNESNDVNPVFIHRIPASVSQVVSFVSSDAAAAVVAVVSSCFSLSLSASCVVRNDQGCLEPPHDFQTFGGETYAIKSISSFSYYLLSVSDCQSCAELRIWYMKRNGNTVLPSLIWTFNDLDTHHRIDACLWRFVDSSKPFVPSISHSSDSEMVEIAAILGDRFYLYTSGDTLTLPGISDSDICNIVYQDGVWICLGADTGNLYIVNRRTSKLSEFDMFSQTSFRAECVTLSGAILAIGVEFAFVFIYLIDDEQWDDLNLRNYNHKIKVRGNHIRRIHITDKGHGPVMYVCSDEAVVSLRWDG